MTYHERRWSVPQANPAPPFMPREPFFFPASLLYLEGPYDGSLSANNTRYRIVERKLTVNKVIRIARFFSVLAVTALAALPASPAATDPESEGAPTRSAAPFETAKLRADTARLKVAQVPLSFEANQGQTDSAVKFLSRGDGYALFLTPTEAVFKLHKTASTGKEPSVVRMKL